MIRLYYYTPNSWRLKFNFIVCAEELQGMKSFEKGYFIITQHKVFLFALRNFFLKHYLIKYILWI